MTAQLTRLGAADVPEVVGVLSEAFFDYPVPRFVLGRGHDYPARLEQLLTFFVMARVLREEPVLGLRTASGLIATALVSFPSERPSPLPLDVFRKEVWARLGAEARARYESFGAATAPFAIDSGHIHLNMIGVRRAAQGQGLGRVVLDAVHELSESDDSSTGVTLTTELESNVALYEHVGYEVIGRAEVASAFTTWAMYRRNR